MRTPRVIFRFQAYDTKVAMPRSYEFRAADEKSKAPNVVDPLLVGLILVVTVIGKNRLVGTIRQHSCYAERTISYVSLFDELHISGDGKPTSDRGKEGHEAVKHREADTELAPVLRQAVADLEFASTSEPVLRFAM